jgi:ApaG protein
MARRGLRPPRHGVNISAMPRYEFTCEVEPQYLSEQSSPEDGVYAFAYTITITNTGEVTAQLIARHWIIENAHGHREEVKGLGVVGQQPLLRPGESFQYTSGTRLDTPTGTMMGSYFCVAEDGERFEAPIPAFLLLAGDTGPVGGGPRVLH